MCPPGEYWMNPSGFSPFGYVTSFVSKVRTEKLVIRQVPTIAALSAPLAGGASIPNSRTKKSEAICLPCITAPQQPPRQYTLRNRDAPVQRGTSGGRKGPVAKITSPGVRRRGFF